MTTCAFIDVHVIHSAEFISIDVCSVLYCISYVLVLEIMKMFLLSFYCCKINVLDLILKCQNLLCFEAALRCHKIFRPV